MVKNRIGDFSWWLIRPIKDTKNWSDKELVINYIYQIAGVPDCWNAVKKGYVDPQLTWIIRKGGIGVAVVEAAGFRKFSNILV